MPESRSDDVVRRPASVGSAQEAADLAVHFSQVMEALLGIVEEETRLIQAGQVREAARLEPQKSGLARQYFADAARLKACGAHPARAGPRSPR